MTIGDGGRNMIVIQGLAASVRSGFIFRRHPAVADHIQSANSREPALHRSPHWQEDQRRLSRGSICVAEGNVWPRADERQLSASEGRADVPYQQR